MPGGGGTTTPSRRRAVEPDHQLPPGSPQAAPRADGRGDAGIGDLIRSLADDVQTLVRQEIQLARMEVGRTARRVAADGAWMATGAAIAAVGGLCLVLALALGLGALLGSYWLGTLITGALLLLLGGGLVLKGLLDLRKRTLAPRRTTASLREDARWARDEAREFKEGIKRE